MLKESTAQLYLRDLGQLVKEMALDAKLDKEAARGTENEGFHLGRLVAMHSVVSLMQQQAIAFGLEASDFLLGDIEPDRDLT